jgi:hypothetical protein
LTGYHPPGVHPDVDGETRRVRPDLLEQPGQLGVHVERRQQRALRVVLVRHRRAVDDEEGVAGELLDEAAVALGDPGEPRDQRADHLVQRLGVERVCQRRESADVREQRRDEPQLLGAQRLGTRAAPAAEGVALGVGRPAVRHDQVTAGAAAALAPQ